MCYDLALILFSYYENIQITFFKLEMFVLRQELCLSQSLKEVLSHVFAHLE